jgi:ketosteroid isomerase-like protein
MRFGPSQVALMMVLAASILTRGAIAQAQATSTDSTIRVLEDQERLAVLREDVAALERLWSPQFIVNNPQNAISADRAVVIDLVRQGRIRYSRFDRRVEAVRFNDDIAIVMGSETVVRKLENGDNGPPVDRRYSHVWKRTAAGWRLIARHANVIAPASQAR